MKRSLMLLMLLVLCCLPMTGMAETPYRLTATVTAEESALLALPMDGAETVLPLKKGDVLVVTVLGTSWCEAVCGDAAGYVALGEIAFDVLAGEPAHLALIDVSSTNQYHGRLTLREEASTKSKALRKLARGTIVLLMEEEGRMVRVILPDKEGYILKGYTKDAVPAEEYRIAYVDPGVNAWLRLDSKYAKEYMIMQLAPGTPVQFISNPNGWAEVEAAGCRGRMLAHNLTFEAPEE